MVYLQRNKHLVVKFISIIATLKFDFEAGHSSIMYLISFLLSVVGQKYLVHVSIQYCTAYACSHYFY